MNPSEKTILVIGGAGYIGSQTNYTLIDSGYKTIVFDNLSKGYAQNIPAESIFVKGDLQKREDLDNLFKNHKIDAIIHFAASIEVGESQENPAKYYQNNLIGTFNLLESMRENGQNLIVFSSTAAVYGIPENIPISENDTTNPINTYGRTKLMMEQIMEDYHRSYGISSIRLRYFNACGADFKLRTGEAHQPESHLIPLILAAANGDRDSIKIFGTDYDTKDGTCIRDYIHVEDLAKAHIKAVEKLFETKKTGKTITEAVNLGTKNGYSVKEIIQKAKKVTDIDFKVEIAERRAGDPNKLIANVSKANKFLNWKAEKSDLENIISSAWKWYEKGEELKKEA